MRFFCLLFALFLSVSASAQKYYLKGGTGYNFSYGSHIITTDYNADYSYTPNFETNKYEESYEKKEKGVYGSFGKGFSFTVGGGKMLTSNISVELDLSYLLGSTFTGKTTITQTFKDNGVYIQQTNEKKFTGRMISITPSVVLRKELSKRYNGYVRAGILIGSGWYNSSGRYYLDLPATFPDTVEEREFVFSGGISVGMHTAIGITTPLDSRTFLFAELSMTNVNIYPTKGELTSYKINGNDHFADATPNQKELIYSTGISYNSHTEQTQSEKNLKNAVPFSSWGISIGLHYTFGKKE